MCAFTIIFKPEITFQMNKKTLKVKVQFYCNYSNLISIPSHINGYYFLEFAIFRDRLDQNVLLNLLKLEL